MARYIWLDIDIDEWLGYLDIDEWPPRVGCLINLVSNSVHLINANFISVFTFIYFSSSPVPWFYIILVFNICKFQIFSSHPELNFFFCSLITRKFYKLKTIEFEFTTCN